MSSLRVYSSMGITINSFSFAVISLNTMQIKMHTLAVLLTSVDSSNCSEKHSQSPMSLHICWIKSSAITSQRRCNCSCRALIEDDMSALFSKSRNLGSAASMNLSVLGGLLVFNEDASHPERCFATFAFEVCFVKNDCCPDK